MSRKPVNFKPKHLPHVLKVLELLSEHINKSGTECDAYLKHCEHIGHKQLNMGRDFGIVAKNCLISHRYVAAAMMLDVVCQELNMADLFFFKATSVILENNSSTTGEKFFNFTRLVRCLKHVNKQEIVLEYLMYVLRADDLGGLHNLKVLMSKQRKTGKNSIIDPLLNAYVGIFDYIEWARCSTCPGQEDYAKSSADKAITCWTNAIESQGQWDIFVLKLVEMLEFYGNVNEAEAVLTKYAEINPKHINSHIYLCSFLHMQNPALEASEKLLSHLKVIAKQCPSDSHVLLLAEMQREKCPKKSLKSLFMFLDYPINSEDLKAWTMFSDIVVEMLQKNVSSQLNFLKSQWAERSAFWPSIHFNIQQLSVQDEECAEVPFQKAVAICAFERIHHPYVQHVLQILEPVSDKLCNELKAKLSDVDNVHCSSLLSFSKSTDEEEMDVCSR